MTVAENLVMARGDVPAVIDWRRERAERSRVHGGDAVPGAARRAAWAALAAGERQKPEILKQLYLQRRFLILDEPTSVLTPQEADEVLGLMRGLARAAASDGADHHPQVPRGATLRRSSHGAAARRAWSAAARCNDCRPRR